MPEELFYNALAVFHQSNYHALLKLKERFSGWEAAWRALLATEKTLPDPEKEWQKVAERGMGLLLREHRDYPALLKEIPHAPLGIYFLGAPPKTESLPFAVVGTRKSTSEGRELAREFSRKLAEKGFTIVSGLALGIDAAAHTGCLEAGGATTAVLGNGLDYFYPRTNEKLAEKILASGGSILSEYPPGTPALPHRFLERNRIISGLARGTLVVEAPERSGSLATARFALDQNRDVFIIPGPIAHPNFKGSNQLIRQGAELVTSAEEILEAYGIENKNKVMPDEKTLTSEEKLILSALRSVSGPLDVDKIIEITTLEPRVVNRTLSFLSLKGFIKESGEGYTITE